MTVALPDPAATDAFGRRIADALAAWSGGLVVSLAGELGAGKTALTRAVLATLGESGPVVSPSYTLVEPYTVAGRTLYHVDLYRLADPAELDFLGLRDVDPGRDWLLIEWADNGGDELPAIDIRIDLAYRDDQGRTASSHALTERGGVFVDTLAPSDSML
ncbi:tRNA (adenosine(37)-N6)-threonylcarbamoyltransferase complex ATPase subunit type 1 TsaE [Salinisphaera orenii]|uniref:tRNA (adenosine(37)-N6)-threonylcarbamoyltransferase complex ATPase subunit type 1 TsaE n=1 Tax=Salinisphaera orenii TaxID=856731 RepID=UPI000DBEA769